MCKDLKIIFSILKHLGTINIFTKDKNVSYSLFIFYFKKSYIFFLKYCHKLLII